MRVELHAFTVDYLFQIRKVWISSDKVNSYINFFYCIFWTWVNPAKYAKLLLHIANCISWEAVTKHCYVLSTMGVSKESISKFLIRNRFHVKLRILSPENCKQSLQVKSWKAEVTAEK